MLTDAIKKLKPSKHFNIKVHIDGLANTHNAIAGKGVFERAIDAIREAKRAGFNVCTNTTIYKNTSEKEIGDLFSFLEGLGVDGMLVSPGFSFEHNDNEVFLFRNEIQERFGFIYGISKKYRVNILSSGMQPTTKNNDVENGIYLVSISTEQTTVTKRVEVVR